MGVPMDAVSASPTGAGGQPALRLHKRVWQGFSDALTRIGDITAFAFQVLVGIVRGAWRNSLLSVCYMVGVGSIPVVAVTGLFIGMVLAVQSYGQFHAIGMETRLGSIINLSVVRELGPVLAATMLAGRVGGALAAELATMRITEQIDALTALGVNPVHYLGAPRFLACVLLIPLLTTIGNFMGVIGGAMICIHVYHVEGHYYWQNTQGFIGLWDLVAGLIKPTFFGAGIAIISCYEGIHSTPGAEGVGRAATRAFVASFLAILVLDFFLAMFLNNLHDYLWPNGGARLF
jgi:phospholipid/cholesterol/gamma-HCH transport system permease protein